MPRRPVEHSRMAGRTADESVTETDPRPSARNFPPSSRASPPPRPPPCAETRPPSPQGSAARGSTGGGSPARATSGASGRPQARPSTSPRSHPRARAAGRAFPRSRRATRSRAPRRPPRAATRPTPAGRSCARLWWSGAARARGGEVLQARRSPSRSPSSRRGLAVSASGSSRGRGYHAADGALRAALGAMCWVMANVMKMAAESVGRTAVGSVTR